MGDWWTKSWPPGVLIFGLLMFLLAVISTFTGKTYLRRVIDRSKDPTGYWLALITQYIAAIGLIWYFYYALAT